MKKIFQLFFLLFTFNVYPQAAEPQVQGFKEIVFSVSNLKDAIRFYENVAGWEVFYQEKGQVSQIEFWKVDKNASFQEALLRNPGDTTGYLRLVQFSGVTQKQIRSGGQSWDTGGIFDVNTRVKDIRSKYKEMQNLGWHAYSDPVRFTFDKFDVEEVLVKGHDGVVIAMIQRHAPPLEGFPNLRQFSHFFNCTQVVKDIQEAYDFFVNRLGFIVYVKSEGGGKIAGPNVLGLPYNLAGQVKRPVYIVHPQGINNGSLELLQFEGLTGKDFSADAIPPNLGILMLRFPVKNLEMYLQKIKNKGVSIHSELSVMEIKPYGKVKIFAIRTPDGAWLEFFEKI